MRPTAPTAAELALEADASSDLQVNKIEHLGSGTVASMSPTALLAALLLPLEAIAASDSQADKKLHSMRLTVPPVSQLLPLEADAASDLQVDKVEHLGSGTVASMSPTARLAALLLPLEAEAANDSQPDDVEPPVAAPMPKKEARPGGRPLITEGGGAQAGQLHEPSGTAASLGDKQKVWYPLSQSSQRTITSSWALPLQTSQASSSCTPLPSNHSAGPPSPTSKRRLSTITLRFWALGAAISLK